VSDCGGATGGIAANAGRALGAIVQIQDKRRRA